MKIIPFRKPSKAAAAWRHRTRHTLRTLPSLLFLTILFTAAPILISAQGGSTVDLPDPATTGSMPLEEALYTRHSARNYSERPLSLGELGQILWAGKGINVDGISGPTQTAASAGGLYPQELYVAAGNVEGLQPGIYVYRSDDHTLKRQIGGDRRGDLAEAALNQVFIAEAPAVIVVGGVPARTASKYGRRGSERYVYMDSAHSAQNILLQATALGLSAAPVGAFDDVAVTRVMELDGSVPIYIIPVGHP